MSAVNLVVALMVAGRENGRAELDEVLEAADLRVVPIDARQAAAAFAAFRHG